MSTIERRFSQPTRATTFRLHRLHAVLLSDDQLPETAIRVLQNGIEGVPKLNQLTSRSGSSVVAVVDRTADFKLAARELVRARLSFGSHSPYAPDAILVNEFVKKDFLQAVVSEMAQMDTVGLNNKTAGSSNVSKSIERLKKSDPNLRIVSQENKAALVELSSRNNILSTRLAAPVFAIYALKSLDNAIDLIGFQSDTPALAAYHFCNPATGKYLSQFITAEASFIHHVPRELLIGPASPSGWPLDIANRYPIDSFTVARAVQIKSSEQLATVLGTNSSAIAQKLIAEATSPLKAFKRNPGGGVGFFEQGFLHNAGLILASTLTVSATGAYWLWRYSRSS